MLLSGFNERMFVFCARVHVYLVGAFSHAAHLCIGSKVVIFYCGDRLIILIMKRKSELISEV